MTRSLDSLRVGKSYHLINYGEETRFEVVERIDSRDYKVKDLLSMEVYPLSDLIKYGTSEDFDISEIE